MSLRHGPLFCVVTALTVLLLAAPAASSRAQAGMTFLDNGRVRLGVEPRRRGQDHVPRPFRGARSGTNLVFQAEHRMRNEDSATVLVSLNTGRELYTKVVPLNSHPRRASAPSSSGSRSTARPCACATS